MVNHIRTVHTLRWWLAVTGCVLQFGCTATYVGSPPGDDATGGGAELHDASATGDASAGGHDAAPAPDSGPDAAPAAWDDEFGGRMLGANLVGPGAVEFSLFAPNATSAAVVGSWGAFPLVRQLSGVWVGELAVPDPAGKTYRFELDGERQVGDPYAKAVRQHRGESIVIDPEYPWTDSSWRRPERGQLVIYELHISDFTYDPSSGVPESQRGRYLGAVRKVDYLRRLGVNAVELMPVSESQSDEYGWGYNPAYLFAPEAAYASDLAGVQVPELQRVVDELHRAGIAVILDVVYNHMDGRDRDNPLWDIDPTYYFDFDGDGDIDDDVTPWGYKVATQRPMVRKLLYDNLRYWMDVYHVDGFRFDSTENIHFDTIADVVTALAEQGYGDRYYLLEEFDAEHNQRVRATNTAAGRTLLSSWGTGYKNAIWSALDDGYCDCTSLGVYTFFSHDDGWQAADEVVSYYGSHDEGTLSARFGASPAQVRVAAVHLLTALGVPMLWMGEEFLREHYGNAHPSGASAGLERDNNRVRWDLVDRNVALVDYFAALIRLRVAHPAFHTVDGRYFTWHTADWRGAIGYSYVGTPGDHDFVVLVNYTSAPQQFTVPLAAPGTWYVMSDGVQATASIPGLQQWELAAGPRELTVDGQGSLVLMSAAVNPVAR